VRTFVDFGCVLARVVFLVLVALASFAAVLLDGSR
jgi:hypothetical protein